MKRFFAAIAILFILVGTSGGCGQPRTINGKHYETAGLLEDKDPCIKYEVSVGNLFWGIVLVETIIAPIYFFGFDLFDPIGLKPQCAKGRR